MDRNNWIGIGLMALLFLGYAWYIQPSEEEIAAAEAAELAEAARADSLAVAAAATAQVEAQVLQVDAVPDTIPADWAAKWGSWAAAVPGRDTAVTLANDRVAITLASRGALPTSAELRDGYTRYSDGAPIRLWDPVRSTLSLRIAGAGHPPVDLADLHFTPVSEGDSAVTFTAVGSAGSIAVRHALRGYQMSTRVTFASAMPDSALLVWDAVGEANEKGIDWERQHSAIYYKEQGLSRDYLSDGGEDDAVTEAPLEWLALKQNFFSALVSTPSGFPAGAVLAQAPLGDDSTATMRFQAQIPLAPEPGKAAYVLDFYFGPNDLPALEETGLSEVERIIDYGWWIFGWVNREWILPVYSWLSGHIASAGLVILILTLIIKLALSPVTWKNYVSSAKMRLLRPEMETINETHKEDAMARQQATMALYRETGVNPLAGCLPALLQMPILYAMFRFFPANIELRGKSFLWADDLGAYDSIVALPFEIPFYGAHISGFTVLMAASTWGYMRLTMASQPAMPQQPGMPNMQIIQQIFPVMMLFFFNRYASGLSLYYLIANVISIGQMYAIKAWFIDEQKLRQRIDENKAAPKKKSAFAERLERMQQEQQRKTKEIREARDQRKSRR
jgi:YidC/Oxa1 family membrane protein insertase